MHSTAKPDSLFLIYLSCILVVGLTVLASATSPVGFERFHDSYHFLKQQVSHGLIPGLVLFFIFLKIPYTYLSKWSTLWYGATIMLLSLVFIPQIAASYGTTRSWITLGFISFQPAELAKFTFIIALAGWLTKKSFEKRRAFSTGLIPFLIILGIVCGLLISQPDVGTMLIFASVAVVMYFSSGAMWRHIASLAGIGVAGITALILAAPYRMARLFTFLNPKVDIQGVGYQLNQATIGIGSGGIFGLGLGHSRQKFLYLPEVSSDSIFAVFAEELGFVVLVGFFILVYLFIARGMRIARNVPDEFGTFLVVGVMGWYSVQTLVNIMAIVGIIPLTGVPLPFVSAGGSALMSLLAGMGVVANVSKVNAREK